MKNESLVDFLHNKEQAAVDKLTKRETEVMSFDTYYALKRKTGKQDFLQDVWEEHEDADNYSFTDNLSQAMKFYDYSRAPRYLWDDLNNKNIETLQELCEFFNAHLVLVEKSTTWKEV